ncbi:PREDICTED: RNA-binding protein 39-like [Prunus mume]|uniref:RNA-binding protein 39-like n=1 Tax=Prunus mume TaxID=102107 RepID=A0ABM1LSL6_PRUMU|nr:PREDICTED: RNA-binding protein 39-like [Prunus mume]
MTLPTTQTSDDWCDLKDNYSMLLQGIVDHEMRFLDIVTGWPGGMTVSRLLKCSGFFKLCEGGQRLNENLKGIILVCWRILNKVMWRSDKRKLPSIILICLKADERDVYELFSRAGKVRDVRLIMDRNSRRSKGVGYIEFYDAMSVPMAIALSGQPLLGQPLMVKPSEAEKNLVQSTSVVSGPGVMIGPYSGGARRLYVGNLHTNIKEDDLRQVFGAFGPVELVQLPVEETNCKGFGVVQLLAVLTS